jgi:hypothetical protein
MNSGGSIDGSSTLASWISFDDRRGRVDELLVLLADLAIRSSPALCVRRICGREDSSEYTLMLNAFFRIRLVEFCDLAMECAGTFVLGDSRLGLAVVMARWCNPRPILGVRGTDPDDDV